MEKELLELDRMKAVEELERKYLNKYYYFLKFAEDELFLGFKTKEEIKEDWYGYYESGISDFAVGAERIVYSMLNGKGIGQPNSSPVGSDLFFEVEDAFIHIDLKTVQTDNIGDYTRSIFVGRNQNSYTGKMLVNEGKKNVETEERDYISALPSYYNKGKGREKICLSYFITILYDKSNLDILVMSIVCMPNGSLEKHYGTRVLQAGKNIDKTRFRFTEVADFELLGNSESRTKVVYFNKSMDDKYRRRLRFFEQLYDKQC
ncbi:hypothetical protein [Gottfriedia solisilvae]|uniref:hypothetical protein n=1 Tax=Gottfriedia solisilvae TaxID=1516104 RepID=UPI003D2F4759